MPYINLTETLLSSLDTSSSQMDTKTVCTRSWVGWVQLSAGLWGKIDIWLCVLRLGKTMQGDIRERCKSKQQWWCRGASLSMAGMSCLCMKVILMQRHMLEFWREISYHQGGILACFTGRSVVISAAQCHRGTPSVYAWLVRLQCRTVSYRKGVKRHEDENQTTTTTECWAAEILHSGKMDGYWRHWK